ncbi:MAG: flagellar protein FlaG [Candidatus Marinimicrobia bacterium]|nr:flagellar protein FlaG [Candidatus Neomarinimicrobiota bacterium]
MESTTNIPSQAAKSTPKPQIEKVDLRVLKVVAAKSKKSSENVAAAAKRNAEMQKQDIDELIRKMNNEVFSVNKRIIIRRHPVNNRQIIQVIDSKTDKVIMEVPSVELVNLSAKIHIFVGMMMDRIS